MTRFRGSSSGGAGAMLLFLGFWAISVLFSLGVTGAIIYVAWHFITKFW